MKNSKRIVAILNSGFISVDAIDEHRMQRMTMQEFHPLPDEETLFNAATRAIRWATSIGDVLDVFVESHIRVTE